MSRLYALLLFSALSIGPLTAQQALTGTITGSVTDASDAVVPSAQITARNINTGLERTATAGDLGLFTIPALPVGEYEVLAKASGFNELKVGPIRVGVGQQVTVPMRLAVGQLTSQVTVTTEAAAIETTRSSVANNVGATQIGNLGLNGRDFLNFVLLTPGVTRDVRTGDLSFAGQRGTLNNLQVDGADNNNNFYGQALGRTGTGRAPYQFSVDTVEEFQVNSNAYSAELGRAGGAVVNVVTRSGTNDFHGSGFWFFRDRELNANTWINNSVGRVRQPFHVNQFGGTLGGPVIIPGVFNGKDKDFFFFNYDGQRRRLPNPVFLGIPIPGDVAAANPAGVQKLSTYLTPYTLAYNQDVYLIKNDLQINANNRLSVRYNKQTFNGEGLESSGNQVANEHSGLAQVKTDTIAASLSTVINPRLLNDVRFQYLRDDEPGIPYSVLPETTIRQSGATALQFGGSSISPRYANIKGVQFADGFTRTSGRHTTKIGADVNHNTIENYFAGNVHGAYTFNTYAEYFAGTPSLYVQAFAGPNTPGFLTKPSFSELGLYVQDEFRVTPKLTLNYGLRYDLALMTAPPVKNPDPQLAQFNVDTSFWRNDKKNISPRFGFAYRPLSGNKLVVRGGYGLFYGRVPQIMLSTAYNQNGVSASSLTFTGSSIPQYPANYATQPASGGTAAVPSIYFFDQNFVLPRIMQGSLGVEMEVAKNTTINITYLNVRGNHLGRTRDINLFPPAPVSVNLPNLGQQTLLRYPGPQGSPLRPMNHFARVSAFESGADSYYNGVTLTFQRRFATRYLVSLSYTLSKAIDTLPDWTSVVPGNSIDEPKIAQYTLYPNLERAASVNDQRHRVVTNFVWDLDYFKGKNGAFYKYLVGGWSLSGIITAQTGQPYSNLVGGDPNNDGNSFNDRVPGQGRNVLYGPTISNWDLRATKSIPIYERIRLSLSLDAFNAFNQANFLASNIRAGRYNFSGGGTTNTFTPTTNFGTYSNQTLDNRILQVSAKITF